MSQLIIMLTMAPALPYQMHAWPHAWPHACRKLTGTSKTNAVTSFTRLLLQLLKQLMQHGR